MISDYPSSSDPDALTQAGPDVVNGSRKTPKEFADHVKLPTRFSLVTTELQP
ncbi:hypothetical protein [Mycobacteroides chelonae]|uniref:hypothetical protein n=1 Tax=Mycobacteroides chelonae TaxID=1774 RepID=UPI0013F4BDE8|nr:hypothetical protein [Mycobacteroides chelonae]